MDIVKVLSNPIRMQVMQYLQTYGEATTKQISESLKDIPTPTIPSYQCYGKRGGLAY